MKIQIEDSVFSCKRGVYGIFIIKNGCKSCSYVGKSEQLVIRAEKHKLDIENGKHPILDEMMKNPRYVSNSVKMDQSQSILLITGPNMGGKSTYMRQTALIIIMHRDLPVQRIIGLISIKE